MHASSLFLCWRSRPPAPTGEAFLTGRKETLSTDGPNSQPFLATSRPSTRTVSSPRFPSTSSTSTPGLLPQGRRQTGGILAETTSGPGTAVSLSSSWLSLLLLGLKFGGIALALPEGSADRVPGTIRRLSAPSQISLCHQDHLPQAKADAAIFLAVLVQAMLFEGRCTWPCPPLPARRPRHRPSPTRGLPVRRVRPTRHRNSYRTS